MFDATNILVKDVHAEIETLSHQSGLSDILHAVTNLGETAGLGTTGAVAPACASSNGERCGMVSRLAEGTTGAMRATTVGA